MRIGLIGSGNIGGSLARLWVPLGHEVWLSNSRGPQTLADFAAELGSQAHAATAAEAAEQGEIVVVSVPFGRFREVPAGPLAGKVVIDTNNYYPARDGQWAELDDDTTTSSELLADHLGDAVRVVKAFNTIYFKQLLDDGTPAGTPERRALPIAGDDADAKSTVTALLDQLGFDTVDAGPLAQGRRFQPDTPPYGPRLDAAALREALG
jgi:8-hydroxy-5-deazaflavin:NADPH oxidoreductase